MADNSDNAQAAAQGGEITAPYYYRFGFGDAAIAMVSDGPLALGPPGSNFLGASEEDVLAMLTRNFLPTEEIVLEQNIPVITVNGKRYLFETGMGDVAIFGSRTGQLQKRLRAAHIDPASIDAVILSHAHIDHVGGICDRNGKPYFPNAQIYLSERDFTDWTDESRLESAFGVQIVQARNNLLPVRDRLVFFRDGEEFLPGLQAIATPGHTFGHHCFMLTSGSKTLCLLGDLTHHPILLMERPMMEFAYDSDPQLSARTRTRFLGILADQRIPVLSYHFAWPGFGHIGRAGEGFRYFPAAIELDPL